MRQTPKKEAKVTTTGLRDYNIINNKYMELHEEKIHVDKEVERLHAAKKYWETHNFDAVTGELYDKEKEKDFQAKREVDDKNHGNDWHYKLPKSWQEEGGLYNPINCNIEAGEGQAEKLYQKDLKEKNLRKRYELRYDIERRIHKEALSEEDRTALNGLNKINYERFTQEANRGFDIMTNIKINDKKDPESKQTFQPRVIQPTGLWNKVQQGSSKGFEQIGGELNCEI